MNHLLTPRDWQAEAITRAARLVGTPEGTLALVEAKRYAMLADELDLLRLHIGLFLHAVESGSVDADLQAAYATAVSMRSPIDWGAVDGELMLIISKYAGGASRGLQDELRGLLRKVSGQ